MPRMTGAEALVSSMYSEGVRVVFGVPGVQLYHALDALAREPRIRFITTRHEQAAAYMAYGYSRASGGIGTAMVVPGPGLLNASAAVGTAYSASSPLLLVSGQIERDLIGVNRGMLHEIDDQLDAIGPVTKWATRVMDAVPAAVQDAFVQLRTGRPPPVEIELPPDALAESAEVELAEPGALEPLEPDPDSIAEGAKLLAAATEPLIVAGGGAIASGASSALQRVAEHLQAPVLSTGEGKGAISDRHHLALGMPGWRPDPLDGLLERTDIVLAVGTRLTRTRLNAKQRVLQIDVDEDEIGRNYRNTTGIVGDCRRSLEELYRALSASTPPRPSRRRELEAVKSARLDPSSQLQPQGSFVRAIRAATYLTSSYFGNLGYAYPTALGAKVARPGRAVVAISGDGGFPYNSQELATAVKYGINAVVIVFNDNAYGNVLRDQRMEFDGRAIGSELHNPDFVKLAEAYGARGVRADGPEELESALREALDVAAPSLIEVPVEMMPSPF